MRITQFKAGSVAKFNVGSLLLDHNKEAERLGMINKIGGKGGAANGRPLRAKTKAGRLNLIRFVYAKMVREGRIIPPIDEQIKI